MLELPSFGRIARTRRTLVLAAGDAVAIAAFVLVGEVRHGGTFASGAQTFLEFAVGWLVAAVVLGAYAGDATRSASRAAGIVTLAWVGAALLGQLVRAVNKPGFYVAPSFVAVSILFGGLALVIWRVVASSLLD